MPRAALRKFAVRVEPLPSMALGAAWLAGMKAGIYPDQQGFAESWRLETRFEPNMDDATRDTRYAGWKRAVAATISA